jgi:hypothetical protein
LKSMERPPQYLVRYIPYSIRSASPLEQSLDF